MIEPMAKGRAVPQRKMIRGAHGSARVAGNRWHPKLQTRIALPKGTLVVTLVEILEQPHVGDAIQCGSAREHQFVAAGDADQVLDDVKEHVLVEQLRRGGLVYAIPSDRRVLDILNIEDRVRIPHLLLRDRRPKDFSQRFLVRRQMTLDMPVRPPAVEEDLTLARK